MGPTSFEYRFRYALHGLLYFLAFWPTLAPIAGLPSGISALGLTTKSVWLVLSAELARQGWLGFQAAITLLLVLAIAFAAGGAWFRIWGSAYLGSHEVYSPEMRGQSPLADGPYRRTRNPLYLGTLLHTVGLSLLLTPASAVFAIAAIWILQVRLALSEEPVLAQRFGAGYRAYEDAVPRFLPSPKPLVAAAGHQPQWLHAVLGESYMIGVVITLAAFGWDFNAFPLLKGILISLGLSLVLRAVLPRARPEPQPTLAA